MKKSELKKLIKEELNKDLLYKEVRGTLKDIIDENEDVIWDYLWDERGRKYEYNSD